MYLSLSFGEGPFCAPDLQDHSYIELNIKGEKVEVLSLLIVTVHLGENMFSSHSIEDFPSWLLLFFPILEPKWWTLGMWR